MSVSHEEEHDVKDLSQVQLVDVVKSADTMTPDAEAQANHLPMAEPEKQASTFKVGVNMARHVNGMDNVDGHLKEDHAQAENMLNDLIARREERRKQKNDDSHLNNELLKQLMEEQERDEKLLQDELNTQERSLQVLLAKREAKRAGQAVLDGDKIKADLEKQNEAEAARCKKLAFLGCCASGVCCFLCGVGVAVSVGGAAATAVYFHNKKKEDDKEEDKKEDMPNDKDLEWQKQQDELYALNKDFQKNDDSSESDDEPKEKKEVKSADQGLMEAIAIGALKKQNNKLKAEYDDQVAQRNDLKNQAKKRGVKHEYGKITQPLLDVTGKEHPYMLKHGENRLPPYFLGVCKKRNCHQQAIFICYYYGDPKSNHVKQGTRYLSCKRGFCSDHAPEVLTDQARGCEGASRKYYVRCCEKCLDINKSRIQFHTSFCWLIVWMVCFLPFLITLYYYWQLGIKEVEKETNFQ